MKYYIFLFYSICFIAMLSSCHSETNGFETTSETLEQRTTNWCDGGANNPPAVYIVDSYFDQSTGFCCVSFRFTSAYVGKNVKLTTTDWNFNTQTGNPGNNNMYFFTASSGITVFCFPQQGSHFLVEILDGNGLPIACNDFPNQC